MSVLEVVEKFVSINGEALRPGSLRYLYVLKGCNLNCKYCDTKWVMRLMPQHSR